MVSEVVNVFCKGEQRATLIKSERGIALMEFAIVLPFILLLVFTSIDLGRAINQYQIMQAAAHSGAQIASLNPGLEARTSHAALTTSACGLVSISGDPAPTYSAHKVLQQEIKDAVTNYQKALPLQELCIKTSAADSNSDSQLDTVEVELTLPFESLTPFFSPLNFVAKSSAPYVLGGSGS